MIEFSNFKDVQTPSTSAATAVTPSENDRVAKQEILKKIIQSIKTIDEQRIVLDQQRVSLEIRRHELDTIAYQLSQLLHKITHSA